MAPAQGWHAHIVRKDVEREELQSFFLLFFISFLDDTVMIL